MGNKESILSDEPQSATLENVENLIDQFTPISVMLKQQKASVELKMRKDILNEKEQSLINSLQVIINLVDSEEQASRNRLAELQGAQQDNEKFDQNLQNLHDKIKQSLDFVTQRVDLIVKRLSNVIRNNDRMEVLELHQKIHDDVYVPVMKIVECLGALRKINEEAGANNTSTKECEAIVKDWTRCNIPFGLAEITFYVCALQLELPDEQWLPNFKELLVTVDRLKSVEWSYELVVSVASGDKKVLRKFDDQLRDYQNNLRGVLPTFQKPLETLSGYNFDS